MKKFKGFCFVVLFLIFSFSLFAQTSVDETQKVKERAEKFLQIVREEKWDETHKFVVVIVHQDGKVIRKRMDSAENADEETKKQIAESFRKLYTAPKPGNIVRVKLNEKDKTVALIEYEHEDLDGFDMVLIDGEWYYTMTFYK
jgi:hypothetical protein